MADVKDKRSVVFVSHSSAGKTSVIDAILYKAGANTRHGSVDEGSSMCDYNEDEIERKITITSKLLHINHNNILTFLMDTPGYADFVGSVISSLRAADSAVCVVCGVSGLEVGTERSWGLLSEKGLPRLIYINKLDKENSDFETVLNSIREAFGKSCLPLEFPVGKEANFKDTASLLEKGGIDKLEGEVKEKALKFREQLVEAIAETDDSLIEKYLGGEALTAEELRQALRKGVAECKIFPVLCGSAKKEVGIDSLILAIKEMLPSPLERPAVEATELGTENRLPQKPSTEEPFSALVFKSLMDPYIGQLTIFRVFSGRLQSDTSFYNASRDCKERIGQLFLLQGKEQKPIAEASAGDIACVAKLKETSLGDTISGDGPKIKFDPMVLPEPAISFSVKPKSRHDEEKIMEALAKISSEDPTFRYDRDPQTKELIISGLGDLHLNVMVDKLKKHFKVNVELGMPKVAYKETVKKKIQVQGKYKKQSGGRGQYGDVWLELEPLPRGESFEFVNKIVGGAVPRQYVPAVEKGVKQAMGEGVIAGYPVVDMRVTIYDGSYHPVDSSEMAFKIAGSMAFKKGIQQASPVLLEPLMDIEVVVPDDSMGTITGDVNSRRGRIMGIEPKGANQVIKAQIPLAELLKYATELRSLTGGRGSYSMKFSHYEEVPNKVAQVIIDQYQKTKEEGGGE
ncbi:MAG: elongation factor G [Candidatus Omnitrophica bacterium]|nr:elongation factor G [Candidatus Omnitrophota bacterium]